MNKQGILEDEDYEQVWIDHFKELFIEPELEKVEITEEEGEDEERKT